MSCVCGGAGAGKRGDVLMLDCDRCHRWFHGPCLGVTSLEVGVWLEPSLVLPSSPYAVYQIAYNRTPRPCHVFLSKVVVQLFTIVDI